jgi:hypothetical protein
MMEQIIRSFINTKQFIDGHKDYPVKPGVYAFYLSDNSSLREFGASGQLIYIGIAKYSLHDRDFKQHFNSSKTGNSTLRRSIGAVLKDQLELSAIPRGGNNDTKRIVNYKFRFEQNLTDWMISNLQIGYWVPDKILTYKQLRDKEKLITIELQPTLDLDPRTKKYNPLADRLDKLRGVCRDEAKTVEI